MSATRDEVLRTMAEAVDSGVQQALRDYGISDEVIGADVERFAASLTTASYALAAAEQAGLVLVPAELTHMMFSEGCAAASEAQAFHGFETSIGDAWAAMIAAAPKVGE